MIFTEHKITLDIHKTVAPVSVCVKKGDTGRRLLINLAERGHPYHISGDCYAVFTAKKPDGKVVFNKCHIEGCVISYDFTEQTVAVAGMMDCEIILYGSDGKQLTSACFNIIVEDTIYDTDTEIESTNEYNALADLLRELQKLFTNGPVAQAIVLDADGTVISVKDASDQALQGLRIFGKSIQKAEPTVDNSVEIENLGACGEITSSVAGQNLLDAYAITAPNTNTAIQITNNGNIIKFYATGKTATYARAELAMNHLIGRKFYVTYDKKTNYGTSVDGYLQIRYSLDGALKYIENIPLLAGVSEIPAEAYDVRLVIYLKNASVAFDAGSYVQYEGLRISLAAGRAWEPYQKIQQITVSTPGGLPGIPVISDGNYTDSDGQQWICDEIDLGRGVYVQRIARYQVSSVRETTINETTNGIKWAYGVEVKDSALHTYMGKAVNYILNNKFPMVEQASEDMESVGTIMSAYGHANYLEFRFRLMKSEYADKAAVEAAIIGTVIYYQLAEPIQTELTAEEIAAYAALHTNKPNTIIYNDAGAYMAAEYVADTKTYIVNKVENRAVVTIGYINLRANGWVGDDSLYSQVVKIDGVTEYSQVDLTPDVEQLAIFYEKDLTFVTENEGGIVTVYAIGQKPENDYTIQVTITEVKV